MTTKLQPLVARGEIVVCPECQEDIAALTDNLHLGQRITAGLFAPMNGNVVETETTPYCSKCGTMWIISPGHKLMIKNRGIVP